MKIKRKNKIIIEIILFVLLLFLDQITKYIAVLNLKGKSPIVVIKDFFEFIYYENSGAAFGILQDKIILFSILTIIILGVIIYFKIKIDNVLYNLSIENIVRKKYLLLSTVLIFLFAGAVGNFIDRIRFNYVVDFLRFTFIDFPIFNVADMLVTISSILLIIILIFVFKSKEFDYLNTTKETNAE